MLDGRCFVVVLVRLLACRCRVWLAMSDDGAGCECGHIYDKEQEDDGAMRVLVRRWHLDHGEVKRCGGCAPL